MVGMGGYKRYVRVVGVCPSLFSQVYHVSPRKSRPLLQKGPQLYHGSPLAARLRARHLNFSRYKGLSGIAKAGESTGKS